MYLALNKHEIFNIYPLVTKASFVKVQVFICVLWRAGMGGLDPLLCAFGHFVLPYSIFLVLVIIA